MLNTRQKILNYISEQQSTTVEELSKVFRVTPANIRHHLSILHQQGCVKVIGIKSSGYKGRPTQIYSTSQQSDLNNLDHLCDALLCTLMLFSNNNENIQPNNEVVKRIGSEYKIDLTNPTRRLYSAIRALNHMNYQAHWEAHIENPRIMLGHCPYHTILDNHPELCNLDSSLLENLLATPVRQVEKQAVNAKGLPQCVFLINRYSS
jgi:predicted ArsR family transcriptional regulator